GVKSLAGLGHALESICLMLGTGPLGKAGAAVPAGVPSAGLDTHFAMSAVLPQVIIDESGAQLGFTAPDGFQKWLAKDAPEIPFVRDIAKPATIVSVGSRGD